MPGDDNTARELDEIDEGWDTSGQQVDSEAPTKVSDRFKHTADLAGDDLKPIENGNVPLKPHEIPTLDEPVKTVTGNVSAAVADSTKLEKRLVLADVSERSGRAALEDHVNVSDVQVFSGASENRLIRANNMFIKEDDVDARLDTSLHGASVYMRTTAGENDFRNGVAVDKDYQGRLTVVMTAGPEGDMNETDLASLAAVSAASTLTYDSDLSAEEIFRKAAEDSDIASDDLNIPEKTTDILVARLIPEPDRQGYSLNVAKRGNFHIFVLNRNEKGKFSSFSTISDKDITPGQMVRVPVSEGEVVVMASDAVVRLLGGIDAAGDKFLFALDTGASPQILCNEALKGFKMDAVERSDTWDVPNTPNESENRPNVPMSIVAFEIPKAPKKA